MLSYGPNSEQVIDVWLAPAMPAHPAGKPDDLLIFLHGGFWRSGYDRAHVAPLAEAFADLGWTVATPEYRRTGRTGGGWPTTFDDVRVAVATLLSESGGDRVVVAGHSAGGQLALWVAGEVAVSAVVALAPVADLRAAYDLDLDGGAVADLLDGGPHAVPERYAAADPMARRPVPVPVTLVHGDRDLHVPVSFSQHYAAGYESSVRLEILAGVDHFAVIDPQSAAWPAVVGAVDGDQPARVPTLTRPGRTAVKPPWDR